MKTTTLSEFREELLSTGGYRTHDDHRAKKLAKPGALSTFRLSWSVGRVFPLCALYESLGRLNTDKWAEFCFSTVTCPESLGMRVILEGWENRNNYKGPVVYLCNHMSSLETIMLPPIVLMYGPFNIVAKQSLSRLPFLGKASAHMGMVPVTRKSPREDLMHLLTVGTANIKNGNSFLIFPQGTREKVFSRKVYSSIGAKLAERAGCPVMPIVIDSRCLPTRVSGMLSKVFKDFGPVDTSKDIRVCCGPVIADARSKVMHEAAFDWMAGKLEEWGLPTER